MPGSVSYTHLDVYKRQPCDARDLNYDKSYFEGPMSKMVEPYNSHNTRRLDVDGMIAVSYTHLDYCKTFGAI